MMTAATPRALLMATDGFEDSELLEPRRALIEQGAEVVIVAPEAGTIAGAQGNEVAVDQTTADTVGEEFDLLVLPGGVENGDALRLDEAAVQIVRSAVRAGVPVAAICHGGWILADADVLRGRTVTSYRSLRTDLTNAGATWVDRELVLDSGLITSRTPDDLPAFCSALLSAVTRFGPEH